MTFPQYSKDQGDSPECDESLRNQAATQLARGPALQVTAEIIERLRHSGFDWWSPDFLRSRWTPLARMTWLAPRPDLRQQITSSLTGLPKATARVKSPEFQAELIDSVILAGDVSDKKFDDAFDARDLVLYGPAGEFWSAFRERMPWGSNEPALQAFIAWTLRVLLADRSGIDGVARRPIMTALDMRAAIDSRVWQQCMPLDIRAAVDDARIRNERNRPREPFMAKHEIAIALPEQIASSIPLADLIGVFAAAEQQMATELLSLGFRHGERDMAEHSAPLSMNEPSVSETPPPVSKIPESTRSPSSRVSDSSEMRASRTSDSGVMPSARAIEAGFVPKAPANLRRFAG